MCREFFRTELSSYEFNLLAESKPINPVVLVDTLGNSFSDAKFQGKWNLIFFGFTHCPEICPMTLSILDSSIQLIAREAASSNYQFIFVTVDPERDTAARMKEYIAQFNNQILGLTGSLEEIKKISANLFVAFDKSANGNEADYTMNHSGQLLVINPQGQFIGYFRSPLKAENISQAYQILQSHF
jgi:protein SCO1/2